LRNFINSGSYELIAAIIIFIVVIILPLSDFGPKIQRNQTSLLFFFIFLIVIFIPKNYVQSLIRKQQRAEDRQTNVKIDAAGEPRLIRDLRESEKRLLMKTKQQFMLQMVLFMVAALFFIFFLYLESFRLPFLLLFVAYLGIFTFRGILSYVDGFRLIYYDQRTDAVMQVEGELIREILKTRRGLDVTYIVRGVAFTNSVSKRLEKIAYRFMEDEPVRIEYGPHSKIIFRITSLVRSGISEDFTS